MLSLWVCKVRCPAYLLPPIASIVGQAQLASYVKPLLATFQPLIDIQIVI